MAAQTPLCDFGWQAIDAVLPGTDGGQHRIVACRGERGLLVAFICNHCPYVIATIDRLADDARELAVLGIGTVAINSNDAQSYPADSFDNMRAFAARHRLPFPYLHDADQSTARRYGAVCTPDLFGFDAGLGLQYRGRIDAAAREPRRPDTRRELFEAMRDVAQTGQGPAVQTPSIGCSIKWRVAA